MGIFYTLNPAEWVAANGVYVAQQEVLAAPRIQGSNIVKIVGEFPWGPTNEVVKILEGDDVLTKLVGAHARPQDYSGYREIVGLTFGEMHIVRVEGSGAAKASRTIANSGAGLIEVEAKHKGVVGNDIAVKYEKVDADTFNLHVKWGNDITSYLALPKGEGALKDVANDYVDLTLIDTAGAEALPDSDTDYVALSGGSDGSVSQTDYTGTGSQVRGLRVLESDEDGGFVFCAAQSGAAIETALKTHAALKLCQAAIQGDPGNDFDAALTYAGGVSDDRLSVALHRVKKRVEGEVVTVDLVPYAASVWSQIPYHYSIADADYSYLLATIVGLPEGTVLSRGQFKAAQAAGGLMLEALKGGGYKFQAAITSDTAKPSMVTRRLADVIGVTLGEALLPYVAKPALEVFINDALARMQGALEQMKGEESIPQTQYILDYSVSLLRRTGTTVIYSVRVKLPGIMRFIVLNLTVGEDIQVELAQAA